MASLLKLILLVLLLLGFTIAGSGGGFGSATWLKVRTGKMKTVSKIKLKIELFKKIF
jgi:hypothetical protein